MFENKSRITCNTMDNFEAQKHQEKTAQPVFVLATQRSGTNYLRSLLRSTGLFVDYNEIFHSEVKNDNDASFSYFNWAKHSYFKYRAQRFAKDPELSIPLGENIVLLFNDYLDYLSSESGSVPYFLVDVKYNSLHHFDPVWHSLTAPNFIFDLVSHRRSRVLHLVRENVFDVYLSNLVSNLTGLYVKENDDAIQIPKILISVQNMFAKIKQIEQEVNLVRLYLEPLANVYELTYESISSEGIGVPPYIEKDLVDFFGTNLKLGLNETTRRIIENRWTVIENADEIVMALKNSPYEWCID